MLCFFNYFVKVNGYINTSMVYCYIIRAEHA